MIVRYIKTLKSHGIHPIISSILFGSLVFSTSVISSLYFGIYPTIGYLFCLSWLFFGPYLIYVATNMIDALWPSLQTLIGEERTTYLQKYERRFHSRTYLLLWLPVAIVLAWWILHDYVAPILFLPFWLGSWWIMALLGVIGVWGVFQLISLMLQVGRSELRLRPLSADRFGGLSFLGDFSIKGTMMFSTGGLMIPIAYELIAETGAASYVIFLTFAGTIGFSFVVFLSFIIPLFSLNLAAKKARQKLIDDAAYKYSEAFVKYQTNPEQMYLGIQILVLSQHLNEAEKMSVWPWDVGVILKLGGSILLPILINLLRLNILPFLPVWIIF